MGLAIYKGWKMLEVLIFYFIFLPQLQNEKFSGEYLQQIALIDKWSEIHISLQKTSAFWI